MFKVGDMVVCIDNDPNYGYDIYKNEIKNLTKHKVYEIIDYPVDFKHYITVIDDLNKKLSCNSGRFILLSDFRKIKINKVCSRIPKD